MTDKNANFAVSLGRTAALAVGLRAAPGDQEKPMKSSLFLCDAVFSRIGRIIGRWM